MQYRIETEITDFIPVYYRFESTLPILIPVLYRFDYRFIGRLYRYNTDWFAFHKIPIVIYDMIYECMPSTGSINWYNLIGVDIRRESGTSFYVKFFSTKASVFRDAIIPTRDLDASELRLQVSRGLHRRVRVAISSRRKLTDRVWNAILICSVALAILTGQSRFDKKRDFIVYEL